MGRLLRSRVIKWWKWQTVMFPFLMIKVNGLKFATY